MRLVARGFAQTVSPEADFNAAAPKLTTLQGLFTTADIHWNRVAFGDCHSAFHQPPMPNDFRDQCTWSQCLKQRLFQSVALQEGFSRSQDFAAVLGIDSTMKINDMGYDQLISNTKICGEGCEAAR